MPDTFEEIKELSDLAQTISSETFVEQIDQITEIVVRAYKNGYKTIFCGNGGSSAEAQHLAAELSGRFKMERKPIPAEACHVNSSFVTAVANDYDFTKVYSRHIEAFGQKGDVLIGLSTSGTSENIVEAFKKAREKGIISIALTGETGGALTAIADHTLSIPSGNVPRIQEIHLLLGHIICGKVEKSLFGNA